MYLEQELFVRSEAYLSHSSSVQIKIAWSYASTQFHVSMLWCVTECRDNFTFIFSVSREMLCYSSFRIDFL
jgi:hypothetical protein